MFTGIVTAGRVVERIEREGAARLVVEAGPLAAEVAIGDSVAVNGCCLTAVEVDGERLAFDCIRETLELTSLGQLELGGVVNLELALRTSDRLGGHFVTGHVDGTGQIESIETQPGQTVVRVGCDAGLTAQLVHKGSVAIDGISLTLIEVGAAHIAVALIPHTLALTNLGQARVGQRVNLETDLLGKYVQKMLAAQMQR